MAKKKSKAQIKRMQQRAAARGETYEPLQAETAATDTEESASTKTADGNGENDAAGDDSQKCQAYQTYQEELKRIEADETLKSKERRSAKRKADAIVMESTKFESIEDLESWYKQYIKANPTMKPSKNKAKQDGEKKIPYIAFFGQLSFSTTQETLAEHIKKELGKEIKMKALRIRMLTDSKTKKSRGMAFVEADTPESLYLLLKLHHTYLEGRRMNVERSAGGGSERRKQKIQQFRQEQEAYFEDVIDKILQEYKKTGELREDELDEGVIGLCRRHSATVVQAALTRYIEGNGRDMDNPSAFLSHLVTKFAEEGIFDEPPHKKGGGKQRGGGNDNSHDDYYKNKRRMTDKKEGGSTQTADASSHKKFKISSEFGKAGINMSASENVRGGNSSQLTSIFPSARRGRGRGH